jgi:hypothetical protein
LELEGWGEAEDREGTVTYKTFAMMGWGVHPVLEASSTSSLWVTHSLLPRTVFARVLLMKEHTYWTAVRYMYELGITSSVADIFTSSFTRQPALYASSLLVNNWSVGKDALQKLDKIGNTLDFKEGDSFEIGDGATFGMRYYCIEANIPNWDNSTHSVCMKCM